MRINVVYNRLINDYDKALEAIEQTLIAKNIEFKSFELGNLEEFGDFTFVIGGDGTLLRAARYYDVPVLGLNMGRLGFLSQASVSEFDGILQTVLDGNYKTEERLMLETGNFLALNDFVIKGCSPSRTSKFYLEINDKFVCDYIADGLIISTPTGSTAYGLSAGGPVVYPTLDAVVIVPICPHTLNSRPLVIPSGEIITVKTADRQLSVSADGYDTCECVEKLTVNISAKKAKLAFLTTNNFYQVLRDKLHWGISPEG